MTEPSDITVFNKRRNTNMRCKFNTLLTLVAAALLVTACGGKGSSPTSPSSGSGPSAVVDVNSLTASSRTWNTGYRTTVDFNLIERGGVAIVIDSLKLELTDSTGVGTCSYEPSAIFGSNRLAARENRYGHFNCDSNLR